MYPYARVWPREAGALALFLAVSLGWGEEKAGDQFLLTSLISSLSLRSQN